MPPSITVSIAQPHSREDIRLTLRYIMQSFFMASIRCTGRCVPCHSCEQSPRFTVACQLPARKCNAVQPCLPGGMRSSTTCLLRQ